MISFKKLDEIEEIIEKRILLYAEDDFMRRQPVIDITKVWCDISTGTVGLKIEGMHDSLRILTELNELMKNVTSPYGHRYCEAGTTIGEVDGGLEYYAYVNYNEFFHGKDDDKKGVIKDDSKRKEVMCEFYYSMQEYPEFRNIRIIEHSLEIIDRYENK